MTKKKKLKLYVWENVLTDYTDGVMFALAPDVATARKLILEKCNYIPGEDLIKDPIEITKPAGFAVWGGG